LNFAVLPSNRQQFTPFQVTAAIFAEQSGHYPNRNFDFLGYTFSAVVAATTAG
jgi:hypothetical protein